MTTQATRGDLTSPPGPPPSSFTQPLCSPSRGCKDSRPSCPFPWMGPPSPKYQRQSLFILNEAAANPRILPEGLLPPDAWVQSLGTRVGFVLEISKATRRCEHALRLFRLLIFTSKPQTKGQVAKNSHWTI